MRTSVHGFDESVPRCLGMDGKERWRLRGSGQGALSASAEGRLIVLDGATFWSSPVLWDGRIHVRSGEGALAGFERGTAQ